MLVERPLIYCHLKQTAKKMQKTFSPKKIIVVLGSGRSGTSLLMRALTRFGMTISAELIPSSVQNPSGTYEDRNIFAVHSDILKALNTNQYLPMPEAWLQNKAVKDSIKKLSNIIENEIDNTPTTWGFKDPRTALFLSMWNKIFNRSKVVPIYLLAVRDPASVVNSMKFQYSYAEEVVELFWLHKNCEALLRTGANCFIVHFEEWFVNAEEVIRGLLEFTGLKFFLKEKNIAEALLDVIKPGLNRSIYENYQIQNEYVIKLYDVLKDCRGSDFDRQRLMQTVNECRKAMDGFKGWLIQSRQLIEMESNRRAKFELQLSNEAKKREAIEIELERHKQRCAKLENKLEMEASKAKDSAGLVNDLKHELEELVLENNKLMMVRKDISDKNKEFLKQTVGLNSKPHKIRSNIRKYIKAPGWENPNTKSEFQFNNITVNKYTSDSNFNLHATISNPAARRAADYLYKYSEGNFKFLRVLIGKIVWKVKYRELQRKYSGQDLKIRIGQRWEKHIKKWGPLPGNHKKDHQKF